MKITVVLKNKRKRSHPKPCDLCNTDTQFYWCIVKTKAPRSAFWLCLCSDCVSLFELTPLAFQIREEKILKIGSKHGSTPSNIRTYVSDHSDEFAVMYESM